MRRRSFLKGAGIVTIAVAGGAFGAPGIKGSSASVRGQLTNRGRTGATPRNDVPLALVRAAILAASPHNTQPWLFKINDSSIELHIDTQRNVGALDPYLREEHIGIGCALENLMLAAPANGYSATAALLPGKLGPIPIEPEPQLFVRVNLAPGKREENELYNAIPRRHTNRGPYDPRKAYLTWFRRRAVMCLSNNRDAFPLHAGRSKKIAEVSSLQIRKSIPTPMSSMAASVGSACRWSSVQRYRDGLTIDTFGLASYSHRRLPR